MNYLTRLLIFLIGFNVVNIDVSNGQCLDDDIIMFPPKSTDLFTGFGRDVVLQDNYLITSSNNSDSLAYESGVILIYEWIGTHWEKIADLTPSNPTKWMQMGSYLRASENIIVATAYTYTEESEGYEVIYVFKKEPGEKWTSRTESYILNPVPDIHAEYIGNVSLTFDIKSDTLWVYHQYFYYDFEYKSSSEAENSLFKLGDESAILFESLATIPSEDGTYTHHPSEVNLKFGDDFMVTGLERYKSGNGKVMVYNYDHTGGWDDAPVELTRSLDLQIGFGSSVAVYKDYVFIANMYGNVFIYKRQANDWTSTNEMAILSISDITGYFSDQVVANNKYVIHSSPSNQKINVFVKDGMEWTSKTEPDFQIDVASENRGYGWEMATSENHFVYNAFDFASDQAVRGSEIYSVTIDDDFESSGAVYDQVLYQHSHTSAGDEFSRNSSFYKSLGVVGTNLDNDKGYASGALNLYERNSLDLTWSWKSKLYSPDVKAYQNFGVAVTITDNYLFASSPFYDSLIQLNGNERTYDMGKVYQFERVGDTWEFVQEILTPDLDLIASSNVFEESHAQLKNQLSQSLSAGFNDFRVPQLERADMTRKESHFSFRNNIPEEILSAGDYDTYRQFGKTIAYHNGYLAIGQRFQGGSEYKGRIYVFKEEDRKWTHVATLQASDSYYRDIIGEYPFAMNDTLIVAGSPGYSQCAFIFKRKSGEEWESGTEDALLLPDRSVLTSSYPAEEFDSFGISVDMYNNTIVVGAPRGETDYRLGPNSGRAYIYEMPPGGWNGEISYKHILKPGERILDGHFGFSVSIDQNNVVVGAPHSIHRRGYAETIYTDGDQKRGRVYVFDRSQFGEDQTILNEVGQILPTGGHSYDYFGARIEKNFLEIVISAPYADTENGDRSGAAYMFKKVGAIEEDIDPLCNESGIIDLVAYPVIGGTWSGEGIIDTDQGLFDPSGLTEDLYTVRYQYGECTTSTKIAVFNKPVIVNSSDPISYLCIGSTVELFAESNKDYHEYSWFYKKSLSDTYSPKPQWVNRKSIDVTDEGYYYCISRNPACTSDPVFFEVIRVDEPTGLNQDGTTKYCLGETYTLSLLAVAQMDQYDWRYNSSTTSTDFISINSNPDLQVTNSGLYFCYFEYLGCGFYSDTVNVQFDHKGSDLNYSGNYELCMEEFILLGLAPDNDPMTDYEWYWNATGLGDYAFLSNDQQVIINQEGDYFCRSYSTSGCAYISDTLEVHQQQVVLVFDPIESICSDAKPIALNVSPPGGRFTIMNTTGGSFYESTLDPKMFENGVYEVMYEYEINHCMLQINQTFEIDILDNEELLVPNAFTPNGDGVNDSFFIRLDRQPATFKFTVVNRAGLIVFESSQFDFQWDGTNQTSGVYYWSMSFGNKCGNRSLKGYVHLLK